MKKLIFSIKEKDDILGGVKDPKNRFYNRVKLPQPKTCACGITHTHSEIVMVIDDKDYSWIQCYCGSSCILPKAA